MERLKRLFFFILFLPFTLFGGETETDKRTLRDLDSLNALAHELRFSEPSRAIELGERVFRKAKERNSKKRMARSQELVAEVRLFQNDSNLAYRRFEKADSIRLLIPDRGGMGRWRLEAGRILFNKHLYEKAEDYFQEARDQFEKDGIQKGIGDAHLESARAYYFRSFYPNALEHAFKAKELFDSLGDKGKKGRSCSRIARIHWAQENIESSKRALENAAGLFREAGDSFGLANTFDLLGRIHKKKGGTDSALYFLRKGLRYHRKAGQEKDRAYAQISIADILRDQGKLDSSIVLDREALEVFKDYQDMTGMINSHRGLGQAYLEKGQSDSALVHFQKGVPLAEQVKSYEELAAFHELLARVHKKDGRGNKAYEELREAMVYEDSLAVKEQREKVAELEARYRMRERKKELALKEEELRRKAVQQYALLGGLALVLLFSGFLLIQFRQKKKANEALVEKNQLIEEKNRDILESLHYASRIQNALLPREERILSHFSSGFVLFKPRETVSGDLYWMEEEAGLFFMAVLDCTGHGVPGALISILGHDGLNKAIKEKGLSDPSQILSFLDEHMKGTFKQREKREGIAEGMDASLCVFDPKKEEVRFAGAVSQLYLIRKGKDEVEEYKGERTPIGQSRSVEKANYLTRSISLEKGDRFYLFSDGYPDQFGGDRGKKLKNKAFQRLLLEKGDLSDFYIQKEELERSFEEWKGDHEQVDDVLVIGVKL